MGPELEQMQRHFDLFAKMVPAPFYWMDLDGRFMGLNDKVLEAIGSKNRENVIGKTRYDLYPKEIADAFQEEADRFVSAGKDSYTEDKIVDAYGKTRYYSAIRSPLHNEQGEIIGVIGTSIEITDKKQAEQLALENTTHKAQLEEQLKFSQAVDQVAHDIRSPLASLLMILKSCQSIPEPQRVALREAANSINDIANNLLHQYKVREKSELSANEGRKPLLVSATLLEVLTDKKYQYQALPVNFDHAFDQSAYFAFIKINVSDFKRMMSNLINNAVDAFDEKEGKIILKLVAEEACVKVIVQDNGKGMSDEVANKIMNKISVTEGKQGGHGIGMIQIRETLEATQGEMDIHSILGIGTQITLTFPRIEAPNWIAEEIVLNPDDTVIILDDDSSIHGAWDTHFASFLTIQKNLQLKHFEMGQDALDFINKLPTAAREKVFLLSDYELLKQGLNGLDVIGQTGVTRAILVTSHYANSAVSDKAVQMGIKILPKQMASEIAIKINDDLSLRGAARRGNPDTILEGQDYPVTSLAPLHNGKFKHVDLVIIEDNRSFAESIITYLQELRSTQDHSYQVDHYTHPHTFLENLSQYPKDTKISVDNDFGVPDLNGLQLAQKLYEQGYTKLYLLSGTEFSIGEVPSYLGFILKTDLDGIAQI